MRQGGLLSPEDKFKKKWVIGIFHAVRAALANPEESLRSE
jgi:hypothetical protein